MPLLFGVSVSKRNFKNATDRNRIKRLVREAYRHHKDEYYDILNDRLKTCAVMFLYIGKDIPNHDDLVHGMRGALRKLVKRISRD